MTAYGSFLFLKNHGEFVEGQNFITCAVPFKSNCFKLYEDS